eukprot:TRINITY_DN22845_c0_g1_i1.p1 TRINITY_DN22845_c0_g1~~TRINITY_DN22845_c0_g1_i1.p1  ORF type:complete len:397 (+),score=20.70 TRINITY_DN22845_c0_g1_i1:82-1191(+)
MPYAHYLLVCVTFVALSVGQKASNITELVAYPDRPDDHDTCPDYTEGTCMLFSCYESRGPTTCKWGTCVCKPGFCVDMSDPSRCVPADQSRLIPVPGAFLISGAKAPGLNLYLSKFGSFGITSGDPGPAGHFRLMQVPPIWHAGLMTMQRPMTFLLTTERWPNYFLQLYYECHQECEYYSTECHDQTNPDGTSSKSCEQVCQSYKTVCGHHFKSGQIYATSQDYEFIIASAANPTEPPSGDIFAAITSGPQLMYGIGQQMYIGIRDTHESHWYDRDPTTFTPFKDVYAGTYLLFTPIASPYMSVYLESLKADMLWIPGALWNLMCSHPVVFLFSCTSTLSLVLWVHGLKARRTRMSSGSDEGRAPLLQA